MRIPQGHVTKKNTFTHTILTSFCLHHVVESVEETNPAWSSQVTSSHHCLELLIPCFSERQIPLSLFSYSTTTTDNNTSYSRMSPIYYGTGTKSYILPTCQPPNPQPQTPPPSPPPLLPSRPRPDPSRKNSAASTSPGSDPVLVPSPPLPPTPQPPLE